MLIQPSWLQRHRRSLPYYSSSSMRIEDHPSWFGLLVSLLRMIEEQGEQQQEEEQLSYRQQFEDASSPIEAMEGNDWLHSLIISQ